MRREAAFLDSNDSGREALKKRFLKASYELYEAGKSVGCRIIPATHPSLPIFSSVDFSKQLEAVQTVENMASVYTSAVKEGHAIDHPASIVWFALRRLNLLPPSDFFDKLESTDVVEVYSKEGFHLFANLRFFDLCSYSLEQIYCRPWSQLWLREQNGLEDLMAVIDKAMDPDQRGTLIFEGLNHSVRELDSPFKYFLDYTIKGIAPVWERKPHRKSGFVIIERAEVLNPPEPDVAQLMLSEFYRSYC